MARYKAVGAEETAAASEARARAYKSYEAELAKRQEVRLKLERAFVYAASSALRTAVRWGLAQVESGHEERALRWVWGKADRFELATSRRAIERFVRGERLRSVFEFQLGATGWVHEAFSAIEATWKNGDLTRNTSVEEAFNAQMAASTAVLNGLVMSELPSRAPRCSRADLPKLDVRVLGDFGGDLVLARTRWALDRNGNLSGQVVIKDHLYALRHVPSTTRGLDGTYVVVEKRDTERWPMAVAGVVGGPTVDLRKFSLDVREVREALHTQVRITDAPEGGKALSG